LLFDRWSDSYDRPGLQLLTYRPLHDAVLGRLRHLHPSLVLDLGCGTGQLTGRLIRRFPNADVLGVDFSDGMLVEAGSRIDAALVRADAHHLPLAPGTVDLVVCTESFHWYRDQQFVLGGLARLLRPGGRLLIGSIATVTDLGDRITRAVSSATGTEIRALPPRALAHLLTDVGFEVTHQRRIPRVGLAAWPVLTEARRR
jgi:malonyl-CoA O-methyltransferase